MSGSSSKGKRVLKTFEKKAADDYRNSIMVKVEAGEYLSRAKTIKWSEAVRLWLNDCERRVKIGDRMTKSTLRAYTGAVSRLAPYLDGPKVADVTVEHIQAAVDAFMEKLSGTSVRHSVLTAGMVFQHAMALGHAIANPARSKRLRLPSRPRRIEVPPKEALRAILAAACGSRGRYEQEGNRPNREVIITLAIFAGLRRGEICGLRWQDIDLDKGVLSVRHSRCYYSGLKDPKTKAGARSIAMPAPVAAALRGLHASKGGRNVGPEDFVILTRRDKPISPFALYGEHWRPVLIKAGLITKDERTPYRLHSLRHAAVSLLIDQGVSPMHVKTFIGHASISTTVDIYGHLFPTDEVVRLASSKVAADLCATQA